MRPVLIGCGCFGLVMLICGLPMLLVPSEQAKLVQKYNDAAIAWMQRPPEAFVPGVRSFRGLDPLVVGTVSTSPTDVANLTIKYVGTGWDYSRHFISPVTRHLNPPRWYLTAEVAYTVNLTAGVAPNGLTFTFGNRSFHRAFPFYAFVGKPIYCTFENCDAAAGNCENPATRRCTSASLLLACQRYFWWRGALNNYTGVAECAGGAPCGECIYSYLYPSRLCTVVDVNGLEVQPSAAYQSCRYPFDLTSNMRRNYGTACSPDYNYEVKGRPTMRALLVVTVLSSADPNVALERLSQGRGFDIPTTRTTAGLVLTIVGSVVLGMNAAALLLVTLCRAVNARLDEHQRPQGAAAWRPPYPAA